MRLIKYKEYVLSDAVFQKLFAQQVAVSLGGPFLVVDQRHQAAQRLLAFGHHCLRRGLDARLEELAL